MAQVPCAAKDSYDYIPTQNYKLTRRHYDISVKICEALSRLSELSYEEFS